MNGNINIVTTLIWFGGFMHCLDKGWDIVSAVFWFFYLGEKIAGLVV